ncbi:chaperonin 60 subunit beta [Tasmannia lanceolata]
MMGFTLQWLIDIFVAGVSLMIGLGFFSFVALILCSAAFLHNANIVS